MNNMNDGHVNVIGTLALVPNSSRKNITEDV